MGDGHASPGRQMIVVVVVVVSPLPTIPITTTTTTNTNTYFPSIVIVTWMDFVVSVVDVRVGLENGVEEGRGAVPPGRGAVRGRR